MTSRPAHASVQELVVVLVLLGHLALVVVWAVDSRSLSTTALLALPAVVLAVVLARLWRRPGDTAAQLVGLGAAATTGVAVHGVSGGTMVCLVLVGVVLLDAAERRRISRNGVTTWA